jgi:hypothetical protein
MELPRMGGPGGPTDIGGFIPETDRFNTGKSLNELKRMLEELPSDKMDDKARIYKTGGIVVDPDIGIRGALLYEVPITNESLLKVVKDMGRIFPRYKEDKNLEFINDVKDGFGKDCVHVRLEGVENPSRWWGIYGPDGKHVPMD